MKIATIGGGSVHTPALAGGLLDRFERMGLGEWWLVDSDPARLKDMADRVAAMVAGRGAPFRVRSSTRREEALEGADFVIVQIRVGGKDARREDERLCRRWGLIDHEATGAGGMSGALRTVPVLLNLAGDMTRLCPEAWLINVTNPAGLLMEALQREVPELRSVGISEGAVRARAMVADALGLASPLEVHLDALGLNHLTWVRGARAGGEDVWRRVLPEDDPAGRGRVTIRLGLIWDYYLQGASGRQGGAAPIDPRPAGMPGCPGVGAGASREAVAGERSGREAERVSEAIAQLIVAMVSNRGQEHLLNTRHLGAVEGLPGEWVLELPCRVFRDRVEPRPASPLPVYARGLLELVKSFELLSVEAALSGSRSAALAALLAHPLGPDVECAEQVLEDLLESHRNLLPRFHGANRTVPG